ncbi:MAG: serine/threonine protein kinase, partial [Aquabacterium sp.]
MSNGAPPTPTAGPANALPAGTRLGEFELKRVLGIGGFGIVYLAFDHDLEREVAVKEYMPVSMAGRTSSLQVSVHSLVDRENFTLGLQSFVNEARLLARFDHPALVKVYRYWEANGTAYMAMPYYVGRSLHQVRAGLTAPPDEAWVRALLLPLLGALDRLHGQEVYHRDIAPDNVLLLDDGTPVLLDFGAARRVLGDRSQALTAILKPSYAPIEQYGEAGPVRQGPWTDLYALGATLHFLLRGRPPPPATTRMLHDDLVPLAGSGQPGCSDAFLACIDWMLRPRPGERPAHIAALRAVLDGRASLPMSGAGLWSPAVAVPPGEATVDLDLPTTTTVASTPPTAPALAGPNGGQATTMREAPAPSPEATQRLDPTQRVQPTQRVEPTQRLDPTPRVEPTQRVEPAFDLELPDLPPKAAAAPAASAGGSAAGRTPPRELAA